MADLDNLIDELFPEKEPVKTAPTASKGAARRATSDSWDSDSSDTEEKGSTKTISSQRPPHTTPHAVTHLPSTASKKTTCEPARVCSSASAAHSDTRGPKAAATPTSAAKGKPEPTKGTVVPVQSAHGVTPQRRNSGFDASSSSSSSTSPRDDALVPAPRPGPIRVTKRPSQEQRAPVVARHHFDDDSDEDERRAAATPGKRPGAGRLTDLSARKTSTASASEAALARPSTAQRVLFTVPFPSTPSVESVGPPCANRCFVSNLGCTARTHPTLALLRKVATGAFDTSCDKKEMMVKKGAFHVQYPKVGNGVLDNGGDPSDEGGCPNLFCLKCHHTVVRLQGAAWCDAQGEAVDLYLTARNFYPDWSRLATSNVVGGASDEEQGLALRTNADAAAYCCQCSWLTVEKERDMIETSLAAAVTYKNSEQEMPFATVLPRRPDEERRPPLWVCKGHPL